MAVAVAVEVVIEGKAMELKAAIAMSSLQAAGYGFCVYLSNYKTLT